MSFYPSRSIADADYLLERAVAESDLADRAHGRSAKIHRKLASSYLDRVFGGSTGPVRQATRSERADSRRAVLQVLRRQLDRPAVTPLPEDFKQLLKALR
jgi:hypothetical protein